MILLNPLLELIENLIEVLTTSYCQLVVSSVWSVLILAHLASYLAFNFKTVGLPLRGEKLLSLSRQVNLTHEFQNLIYKRQNLK